MRIGWTTCGLVWCLALVADSRRLGSRQDVPAISGSTVVTIPAPSSSPSTPSSSSNIDPSDPPRPSSSSSTSTPITNSLPLPPDTPPTSPPRPVPIPMDLTVSYSLSDDCMTFMTTFLTNTLFQSCLPLSLLLTTSTSYRELVTEAPEDGYELLNNLVAYTSSPQPSSTECDDYFVGLSKSLVEKKNCGADLSVDSRTLQPNPVAMDTKRGLGNYKVVREASALKDPNTGVYCYLQAVADTRPDDMYLWSLPAGIPVPRSSKPTCSACSVSLLNHYTSSLSTPSSTLNSTLVLDAVNTVNAACGGSLIAYNNVSIANGAGPNFRGPVTGTSVAVMTFAAVTLLPIFWTL